VATSLNLPASCNARFGNRWDAQHLTRRTLIVDDNPSFLAAAKALLDGPDFAIVGLAATSAHALEKVDELDLDLVLLDIDLGEENGIVLARTISDRLAGAAPKLVLISAHPEEDFADLIAESPAIGFLAKSELSRDRLAGLLRAA
jgi:DNA-binding NarL/FixJ family response regulator